VTDTLVIFKQNTTHDEDFENSICPMYRGVGFLQRGLARANSVRSFDHAGMATLVVAEHDNKVHTAPHAIKACYRQAPRSSGSTNIHLVWGLLDAVNQVRHVEHYHRCDEAGG
jgi:hypothetical protein